MPPKTRSATSYRIDEDEYEDRTASVSIANVMQPDWNN